MDDANKVYIQLSREISELDKDLARGLASVGYMAKANKSELVGLLDRIKEIEGAMDALLDRIKEAEKELKAVQRREAADQVRIQALEDARKEHTGKFETLTAQQFAAEVDLKKERHRQKTERIKAKLSFWGPIVILVLTNIISLVLHWVGVPSKD